MGWFQLDPESIAERTRNADRKVGIPSFSASVWRGILGFTILSVAGFAPWAFFGRWFYRNTGEAGLYLFCALVFIALSGPLLHRLIIGPGSLSRFYKVFGAAFAAYSVAWIAAWMLIGGHAGSIIGLLLGTVLMGWILTSAFEAGSTLLRVIAVLFILNSLGYFAGGWIEPPLIRSESFSILGWTPARSVRVTTAMLLWGVCYGAGFGAGLGATFYYCQERTRALIRGT